LENYKAIVNTLQANYENGFLQEWEMKVCFHRCQSLPNSIHSNHWWDFTLKL